MSPPLSPSLSAAFSISSENSQVVLIAVSSAVAIILLTVLLYIVISRSVCQSKRSHVEGLSVPILKLSLCCLKSFPRTLDLPLFRYEVWKCVPLHVCCLYIVVDDSLGRSRVIFPAECNGHRESRVSCHAEGLILADGSIERAHESMAYYKTPE